METTKQEGGGLHNRRAVIRTIFKQILHKKTCPLPKKMSSCGKSVTGVRLPCTLPAAFARNGFGHDLAGPQAAVRALSPVL